MKNAEGCSASFVAGAKPVIPEVQTLAGSSGAQYKPASGPAQLDFRPPIWRLVITAAYLCGEL